MKKTLYTIFTLLIFLSFQACNYLDIVPDERVTEEDAFKNADAARRFLYSCYGYLGGELGNPRHSTLSIDWFTADEVVTPYEDRSTEKFADFAKGTYDATNVQISYWNNVFAGIRQCYLLLENIDGVPGMTESNKRLYKGEATFMIAYYHYLLVKNYGATIIVRERTNVDDAPEKYLSRESYDDCVEWVVGKFNEAIDYGLLRQHAADEYGRATIAAAKALIARMRVYAASPQFNGGSYAGVPNVDDELASIADDLTQYYQDPKFVDKNKKQLISTTYDSNKWSVAAAACLAAIEQAHADGHQLYYAPAPDDQIPFPVDQYQRNTRFTLTDGRLTGNTEAIWASTIQEDSYAVQHKSTPRAKDVDWNNSWNSLAPRMNIIKAFYTENGLPIDVDPTYFTQDEYMNDDVADQNPDNGNKKTMALHIRREPRFYAWISFHNGWYELRYGNDESAKNRIVAQYRYDDAHGKAGSNSDYSLTGYLNKKGVHPLFGQHKNGGMGSNQYPWPIIRLAELYLNYAEALIELNNIEEAKIWIDKVRKRAGIPTLDVSWAVTGKTLDQKLMRQIVRRERQIEFYLENQRFWDVRRWLIGKETLGADVYGLNVEAKANKEFFQETQVKVLREFRVPNHYLMPIPNSDIRRNPNIVQNPGY